MKSRPFQFSPLLLFLFAAFTLIGTAMPMAAATVKLPPRVIVSVKDASKVAGLAGVY